MTVKELIQMLNKVGDKDSRVYAFITDHPNPELNYNEIISTQEYITGVILEVNK